MLNLLNPWHRKTDPATSRQKPSKRQNSDLNKQILYHLSNGDCTGSDIASLCMNQRDTITPALNRLWKAGLVGKRDYAKIPSLGRGTNFQQVWYITQKGMDKMAEHLQN